MYNKIKAQSPKIKKNNEVSFLFNTKYNFLVHVLKVIEKVEGKTNKKINTMIGKWINEIKSTKKEKEKIVIIENFIKFIVCTGFLEVSLSIAAKWKIRSGCVFSITCFRFL